MPGSTASARITGESGVCRPGKPIATNVSGKNISDDRADEFGSLIVTATAAKKQFQKKMPSTDSSR